MTTTQYLLIIIAVAAIVGGIMLILKAVRKAGDHPTVAGEQPPHELETTVNDGEINNGEIPIVPRHERPEITENLTNFSYEESRQRAINADTQPSAMPLTQPQTTDTVYGIDKSVLENVGGENNRETHPTAGFTTAPVSPNLTQNTEPDAFSALANATETLTPVVQTYDETQLNTDTVPETSPILDTHIQAQTTQDQNSPLNNAQENINISLFPNSQFDRITGKDLLALVDKYGLKYGAMNMFHRYENKDGTGILWFSMMQVDDEDISPFDLNKLPMQSFKGLVLFLSLPHPKAVHGFDSMMSVAALLAQDLDASIYDETGEPINRENTQAMRDIAMSYGRAE